MKEQNDDELAYSSIALTRIDIEWKMSKRWTHSVQLWEVIVHYCHVLPQLYPGASIVGPSGGLRLSRSPCCFGHRRVCFPKTPNSCGKGNRQRKEGNEKKKKKKKRNEKKKTRREGLMKVSQMKLLTSWTIDHYHPIPLTYSLSHPRWPPRPKFTGWWWICEDSTPFLCCSSVFFLNRKTQQSDRR